MTTRDVAVLLLCTVAALAAAWAQAPTDDPIARKWRENRFYLAIVANEYTTAQNNLSFLKADRVAALLEGAGYRSVISEKVLTGQGATRTNVISALKRIRAEYTSDATVVVFYSGHGELDQQDKDVWLQLYGQNSLGDIEGITITDMLKAAREGGESVELLFLIDACHSGRAALPGSLSLKGLGTKAVVLSSSSPDEQSFAYTASGDEVSAFTFLLEQALGPDWKAADTYRDGFLTMAEIHTYLEKGLREIRQSNWSNEMKPLISGNYRAVLKYSKSLADPATWEASHIRVGELRRLGLNNLQIRSVFLDSKLEPRIPRDVGDELRLVVDALGADEYANVLRNVVEGRVDLAIDGVHRLASEPSANIDSLARWTLDLSLARLTLRSGNSESATELYEKLDAIQNDAQIKNELGIAQLLAGKTADAESSFASAVDMSKASDSSLTSSALSNLALISTLKGKPELATAQVEDAVMVAPNAPDPYALRLYSTVLERQGNEGQAVRQLQRSIEVRKQRNADPQVLATDEQLLNTLNKPEEPR